MGGTGIAPGGSTGATGCRRGTRAERAYPRPAQRQTVGESGAPGSSPLGSSGDGGGGPPGSPGGGPPDGGSPPGGIPLDGGSPPGGIPGGGPDGPLGDGPGEPGGGGGPPGSGPGWQPGAAGGPVGQAAPGITCVEGAITCCEEKSSRKSRLVGEAEEEDASAKGKEDSSKTTW